MRPDDARILVVDDEPKICDMLQTALERQDYQVAISGDGADALERFRARPFDIVISDLRMPGVDGCQLIRQIKQEHPGTFVVAITGHATVDSAVHALQNGADDYVTKPFDIRSLRRIIETYKSSRALLAQGAQAAASCEPRAASQEGSKPEARSSRLAANGASPAQDLLEANRRLEARVAELQVAQDIGRAIAAELDLDRLLATCLDRVAGATGAGSLALLTLDDERTTLVVRARHGRDRRYLLGERRAVGEGIAGWVAEHRVPLLVPSLDEQPAFQQVARADGYTGGTLLAVPLEVRGRLLGVLNASDKRGSQPFDDSDLRLLIALSTPIAISVENACRYRAAQEGSLALLDALTESVEARDGYWRGHARRVADLATRAARELGLSGEEVRTLRQAALVHDIGRAGLSDSVIGRAGPLTDADRAAVRRHPIEGERVLETLGFLAPARPLVRHHHERWDGRGYPDGLAGREIDPLTRILTLADAYDAMTSERPHRSAKSSGEALAEMAGLAGSQFDPSFVDPFRRAIA